MFTSSLRRRLPALITAAAAAVIALAVPAGASTGTTRISPEQAGYTATGAQFKVADTWVYLRNPAQYAGMVARYGHSLQLWSSDVVATVTLTASTSGDRYTNSATIYDRHTHQVIASNPNAGWAVDRMRRTPPGSWHYGAQVDMGISYDKTTGTLSMWVDNEGNTTGFGSSYTIPGQSFTEARIGTEFGTSPWDASYSYTPPAAPVKVAAYTDVWLISYSGHQATLSSWWVNHKLLANTGQQSGSDWVAVPDNLTGGGASFQTWFVPQSGQSPTR
jgi:hypothetical protein